MCKPLAVILLFAWGGAVAMAGEAEKKPLVEAGKFVKIYDPTVGQQRPWYINDHCFVFGPTDDGQDGWHLFGITDREPPRPTEEKHFAHATAKTLLQRPWDRRPFAIAADEAAPWHERHLWAPHVILHDRTYYMYYCVGSMDNTRYKIHLATSHDLWTWTRHPKNPMVVDGYDARDPFVMCAGNRWVMYYTATSKPSGGNHIVAYTTSDDLVTWKDRGVAFVDPSTGTWGGPTESPFVVRRDDRYYLFIGPRPDYVGTDVFVSRDPFHWKIEDKVGHIPSHAAEVVRDIDGKWYVSHCGWGRGGVYLVPLVWHDGLEDPKTNIPLPKRAGLAGPSAAVRLRSDPPVIRSSWDDLLEGVKTAEDWRRHREVLRERFLELIRDKEKPPRPELDLKWHESTVVDGVYTRWLVSYQVEADERAYAFLGIPLSLKGKTPGIVALHGTHAQGKEQAAGLVDNPDKAYLDHLCRRGYVVIAPDHFVAGGRIPPEGAYDTARFYQKHPRWTAVGKSTYEGSVAIDVLVSLAQVEAERIGVLGHSLGGQGTIFLAAYDGRVKAAGCNCAAAFFRHNRRVEDWARDHWYVYFKPIRPGLLRGELPPIDFHEIMALVAPRAFLDVSALNDGDPLTQRQRVLMLMKVMDVYELLGAPQNFSFFVHGRGHSVSHESRELLYGWMDSHLQPPETTKTQLVGQGR